EHATRRLDVPRWFGSVEGRRLLQDRDRAIQSVAVRVLREIGAEVRRLHESRSAARRHEKTGAREPPPELRAERVLPLIAACGAAMMAEMRLHFLGATRTVTGSQYLLETDRARVLIDCGMFQGSPNDVIRNRVPFAYSPNEIDALLLTHAHLDHCGLIPHLSASGFKGMIYATKGSVDLTRLVLLDSAKLQEEFSQSHQRFAKKNPDRAAVEDEETMAELAAASKEDPAAATREAAPAAITALREPLYTVDDTNAALGLFRGIDYGTEMQVAPGITATYLDAGHILGSAIIRVRVTEGDQERTIVFSGDLGRPGSPIIRDPTAVTSADYLLIESTYGGKTHEPQEEAIRMLGEALKLTGDAKGVLLVPSFAIGRTQEIVYELNRLLKA